MREKDVLGLYVGYVPEYSVPYSVIRQSCVFFVVLQIRGGG